MKTKSFTLVILAIFGMVIFTNYTSKNTKETDASSGKWSTFLTVCKYSFFN